MKLKIHILILLLLLSINLGAQEKYGISSHYKDISFTDFVTKVESILPVKFYYIDDWVNDLKLGDYPDCTTLQIFHPVIYIIEFYRKDTFNFCNKICKILLYR